MKSIRIFLVAVAWTASASAATEQEIKQAFERAQKKGAVAVYENRCGGMDSLYFPGSGAAKTAAALSVLATAQSHLGTDDSCTAQQQGQSQILELYPDGSVKAH